MARASLGELLLDYEDFLLQRGAPDSHETLAVRKGYLSDKSDLSDGSDKSELSDMPVAPDCPLCWKPMHQRTARTGPHAGQLFWGFTGYPDCKGIRCVLK